MFTNDATDRDLFHKQTVHTTQSKSNPIKNWAEDLNRCFSKDRHIDDQQAYEKMFYLLINREIKLKPQ